MSEEQIIALQRKLAAMQQTMVRSSFLTVLDVRDRWNTSRASVDGVPLEVLPYIDLGSSPTRSCKRFNPLHVIAAEEIWLPQYRLALSKGREDAFLRNLGAARDQHGEEILKRVREWTGNE